MCFNISAAAWTTSLPGLRKFVLLALCDRADKAGKCWPSMDWIATRCGISERAARSHVSALVQQGLLRREFRLGRSPVYHVSTPAIASTPANPAALPLPIRAATPAIAAPISNHDPIIETINIAPAVAAAPVVVVDKQVMQDFAAVRKAKKRPAVTRTELDALTTEGAKIGMGLSDVLKTCVIRGWTRFEASWLPTPSQPVAVRPVEPSKPASASTVTSALGHLAALRNAIKSTGTTSLEWAHTAIAKKKAGEYVAQAVVRNACEALHLNYRTSF